MHRGMVDSNLRLHPGSSVRARSASTRLLICVVFAFCLTILALVPTVLLLILEPSVVHTTDGRADEHEPPTLAQPPSPPMPPSPPPANCRADGDSLFKTPEGACAALFAITCHWDAGCSAAKAVDIFDLQSSMTRLILSVVQAFLSDMRDVKQADLMLPEGARHHDGHG